MKTRYILTVALSVSSLNCLAIEPLPDYWRQWTKEKGTHIAGLDKDTYRSKPDSLTVINDKNSVKKGEINRSGICQEVKTTKYLGKRVRYSAFIKTRDIEHWAYIYAISGNIYPFKGVNAYNDGGGTQDWTFLDMVFDIPQKHKENTISLCFSLWQGGQMWIDDIKWEIVDDDTPVTYEVTRPPLDEPILK